jgi:hypothetical protein
LCTIKRRKKRIIFNFKSHIISTSQNKPNQTRQTTHSAKEIMMMIVSILMISELFNNFSRYFTANYFYQLCTCSLSFSLVVVVMCLVCRVSLLLFSFFSHLFNQQTTTKQTIRSIIINSMIQQSVSCCSFHIFVLYQCQTASIIIIIKDLSSMSHIYNFIF